MGDASAAVQWWKYIPFLQVKLYAGCAEAGHVCRHMPRLMIKLACWMPYMSAYRDQKLQHVTEQHELDTPICISSTDL